MPSHRSNFTTGLRSGGHFICTASGRLGIAPVVAFIAALALSEAANAAKPFLPADDSEVLESLPRDLLSSRNELATLRRQLAQSPHDAELAANVATRYLQLGKQEGDPRFNGYAQAAIKPWWDAANPPIAILRLRAKLKERDHRYDEALADLERLLEREPHDVQALVELANIYRVQGRYAESRAACDRLREFAGEAATILGSVPLMAATGQSEEAYSALAKILPTVREQWPAALQWVFTTQAEIARALGRNRDAERHYREGLANDPQDKYLLRSYADFLLDGGREEEVLQLLGPYTSDTGILLCLTIAAHRSSQQTLYAQWHAQLQSRFEETRLRGDQPHGRFEARFELELKNNPQRALALAQANWQQQKEPHDTRVLLEAAIAANDRGAAQPVLEFLQQNGTQDIALQRLVKQLERN
jgi:tetratricopeptide (TPR) repeat protein